MEADDVRQVWSQTLKSIMLSLETLADVIERDAGLTPDQVKIVERVVDGQRAAMYETICREN